MWTIYISIYPQFFIYTTLLRHTKLLVKYLFLNVVFIISIFLTMFLVSRTYLNINWRMSVSLYKSLSEWLFCFSVSAGFFKESPLHIFKESPLHMSDHFIVLFFFNGIYGVCYFLNMIRFYWSCVACVF